MYAKDGAILTISLHRPERLHALSRGLLVDLKNAMEQAAADPEIRAIILTGTGNRAFCTGADLKDAFGHADPMKPSESLDKFYHPALKAIRNIPKPVICALNGVAAGAGASLAFACDYIIAADTASFSVLFIRIGLVPDCGINYMLPRSIGIHKAFELFSTGRSVDADEAKSLGIFNEVVAAEHLTGRSRELAEMYAKAPTKTIGLIKNLLNTFCNSRYVITY